MKSFISYSVFALSITSCASHSHSELQKHWHSCDGEAFYTPIQYDDELKSCVEIMKEDIIWELKKDD